MQLYDKSLIGPLELNFDNLPNTPAVYIISRKGIFEPQYIGFTTFLSNRLKSHPILVQLDIKEHQVYYCEFDEDESTELRNFEKKLILKYQPPFNKLYVTKKRREEKVEKTKRFSNILAGASSSIAIAALIFTTMGLFFTQDTSMSRSELSVKSTELEKTIVQNTNFSNALKLELNTIRTELKAITSVPDGTSWKAKSVRIEERITSLETKLKALEDALTLNPAKALAIPILRKDLDNAQGVFKSEINQTRAEVNRIYDQNKWFIGLMFTIALSVLGMAVSNFIGKKDS